MSFFSHLGELRDRLIRSVVVVVIIFCVLFYFKDKIYTLIAMPMLEQLAGVKMLATRPASSFFIPMKLALVSSVFIAIPYLLYQIWAFVAPGLYQREKRLALPLLFSSTVLFYAGMAFAYFVVFPLIFRFFATAAPAGVEVRPDITEYLDLVLGLFLAFGAVFEVPVATVLCVAIGIVTPDQLTGIRRYMIVVAFIVGMLLTPPDVVSQFLLAVPMWLLYEVGIIMSRIVYKRRQAAAETETDLNPDHEFEKAIADEAALLKKINPPPNKST
ncbi:MAG: twin-arginine translocase subunit TatC [Gammaproteobacteria bacterium]|nr:twin-arginine translocase subunit TatC [Gammaproteobacteria bacterium]